jgi:hypothetical protein
MMGKNNFLNSLLIVLFISCIISSCPATDRAVSEQTNMQSADKNDLFPIYNTCTYNQFQGRAQILSINWINENYVEMTFNFILSDPELKVDYRFPRMGDSGRKKVIYLDPEKHDNVKSQLRVGDVIPCLRSEIIKGTCTPVVFTFPDLEF